MFGAIVLILTVLVGCSDHIDGYVEEETTELLGEDPSSYDCEVMDPVTLAFGKTRFIYPAKYGLPLLYDNKTNPISRRLYTREYYRNNDVGPGSEWHLCATEYSEPLKPDRVTIHSRQFERVEQETGFRVPNGVLFFSISLTKHVEDNPDFERLESAGAEVFMRCFPHGVPDLRQCSFYKRIDDAGLYLSATIHPAKMSVPIDNGGSSLSEEDQWLQIMSDLEVIISTHLEAVERE